MAGEPGWAIGRVSFVGLSDDRGVHRKVKVNLLTAMAMLEAGWVLKCRVCTRAPGEFDCIWVVVYKAQTICQAEALLRATGANGCIGVAWNVVVCNVTSGKVTSTVA